MLFIPFIFIHAFPRGRVAAVTALGGLAILRDQLQSKIVLLAPHQDETKQGRRCTVFTAPRPWMTSEPFFRGFSQLDLPRQSFVGGFWTHVRNRYIDICAISIPSRCDFTFRALRISQLRTLSRNVTPRIHRKNHLRHYFGHYPRFKTIGKDRNKDRFTNWQLYGVGLSFRDHTAIKLMKNCVIFGNPSISLIAPPSVTCKYHHYVLTFLHLLLQCIPLTCSIRCLWFVERHNTSIVLVLIFILAWSHAAESWSSACWRPCWEDASSTKSSAKTKRLILDSAVTVYPIHVDQGCCSVTREQGGTIFRAPKHCGGAE